MLTLFQQPPKVKFEQPTITEERFAFCLKLIEHLDLVESFNSLHKPAILIFLPGWSYHMREVICLYIKCSYVVIYIYFLLIVRNSRNKNIT